MQTKSSSFKEAALNTSIGFVISLITQVVTSNLYGAEFTLFQNLQITAIFTVISLVRSYVIRRWFNKRDM